MPDTAIKERAVGGDRSTFSRPEMIRAALEDRKTQFRVPIKPQPPWEGDIPPLCGEDGLWRGKGIDCTPRRCPYEVGMVLWVREAWCEWTARELFSGRPERMIAYKAGRAWGKPRWNRDHIASWDPYWKAPDTKPDDVPWRPSIHMPKWAARLWLEVVGVKVERVQDISEADAIAEGIYPVPFYGERSGFYTFNNGLSEYRGPIEAFRALWDSIHGKTEFAWEHNPYVWAVTVRRIKHGN